MGEKITLIDFSFTPAVLDEFQKVFAGGIGIRYKLSDNTWHQYQWLYAAEFKKDVEGFKFAPAMILESLKRRITQYNRAIIHIDKKQQIPPVDFKD